MIARMVILIKNEEIIIQEDFEQSILIQEDTKKQDITIIEDTVIGGTNDYEELKNKPKINDIELIGNKTSSELKLQDEMTPLTNIEIIKIIGGS